MNHDATIRARWGRESVSSIAASLGVDPRTVARRAAQLGLDLEAGRQAGVKAQHDGGQVWKRDLVSQAVESRSLLKRAWRGSGCGARRGAA